MVNTHKRPELLLLDEHTAALDPKTSVALMSLLTGSLAGTERPSYSLDDYPSHGRCSKKWQASSYRYEGWTNH